MNGTDQIIQIPEVGATDLSKILLYCEYHRSSNPPSIPKPLKSNKMSDLVDAFDAQFVDSLSTDEISALLIAANYMDIYSLVELLCAKLATLIKGIEF